MRVSDQITLITRHMKRRRRRTALTAVGLAVSSASMLLLIAISLGTQQTAKNQFADMAELRQIIVTPNILASNDHNNVKAMILNRKAIQELSTLSGVQAAIPRQEGQFFQTIKIGKYTLFGFFYGMGVDDLAELGYSAEAGTSELKKGMVILSQDVLDSFFVMTPGFRPFTAQELIGQKFTLKLTRQTSDGKTESKTIHLQIEGVLKTAGGEKGTPALYVALDDVKELNRWINGKQLDINRLGYDSLLILVKDVSQVKTVAERLTALGYTVEANLQMSEGVSSTYALIQIMLGGAGVTALLVAVVTIINTMTTAVLERTREIGLMKALGADQSDVLRLFLGEAILVGLLGGIFGVLSGGVLGWMIDHFGRSYLVSQGAPQSLSVSLPMWLFLVTLIMTAMLGGLSGLYPAVKASRLAPIVALKQRK